jgi:hypothetical protein
LANLFLTLTVFLASPWANSKNKLSAAQTFGGSAAGAALNVSVGVATQLHHAEEKTSPIGTQ